MRGSDNEFCNHDVNFALFVKLTKMTFFVVEQTLPGGSF